jgi:hypothetical protein
LSAAAKVCTRPNVCTATARRGLPLRARLVDTSSARAATPLQRRHLRRSVRDAPG